MIYDWVFCNFYQRWARWPEILAFGQFRQGWSEKAIEDCARLIVSFCFLHCPIAKQNFVPKLTSVYCEFQLVHCVNNFRGDEKVRSFVQDLIFPSEDGAERLAKNHSGIKEYMGNVK